MRHARPTGSREAGDEAGSGHCLNCGERLHGRYCSACGQEAVRDLAFGALVADAFENVFNLDSRVWRTLRELFTRPGALSATYRAGRRASYVPPLRLYLVSSVLFFAALELAPVPPIVRITGDIESASEDGAPAAAPDGSATTNETTAGARGGLAARMVRAADDPERLNRTFMRGLAWTMFLLIPVFALLLRIAWRRRRLLYVYHLVFALHVHAFAFLLLAAALAATHITAPFGQNAGAAPVLLAGGVNAAYLVLATRRFYDARLREVLTRLAVVGGAYILAILVANLLLLLLVLLLF